MSKRRVITDREVRRAKREGKTSLDISGAVVTPGGRDAAKAVGLELTGGHASRSVAPATSSASAAVSPAPAPASRSDNPLTIAVGADHGGVTMKDAIATHLRDRGHTVRDLGTTGTAAVDYPDFAIAVARAVASGDAAFGIMVDGAGIGSAMAANKIAGVRAALCYDVTSAGNAREHNNANMLTLGGGLIGTRLALAIVDAFLTTSFAGGRHQARVDKIDALDGARGGR